MNQIKNNLITLIRTIIALIFYPVTILSALCDLLNSARILIDTGICRLYTPRYAPYDEPTKPTP